MVFLVAWFISDFIQQFADEEQAIPIHLSFFQVGHGGGVKVKGYPVIFEIYDEASGIIFEVKGDIDPAGLARICMGYNIGAGLM